MHGQSSTPFPLLKKAFGFFEEGLAEGAFFAVAEFGEFLELGFLGRREMGGDFDVDADVKVAETVALDIFYAFAFEAEHGGGLSAGRDSDRGFAVQCWDLDVRAESGLNEIDGDFAKQVVAIALEDGMGFDVEDDVEIAGRTAAQSCFPIAGGTQARA